MRRTTLLAGTLLGSWVLHDLEELATGVRDSRRLAARAPAWVPLPDDVRRHGVSQQHLNVAIGVMALVMGAASVDGVRTGGRSWVFQAAMNGYGLHGIGHLALSAATRGYTSGAATAPVVVLPYWWWARRELRREGVPLRAIDGRVLALLYPTMLGAHMVARWVTRPGR